MKKIFIRTNCHNSGSFEERLANDLKAALEHKVIINDDYSILPGTDLHSEIKRQIFESNVTLFVVRRFQTDLNSLFLDEVKFALQSYKRVILVLVDDVQIQYEDFDLLASPLRTLILFGDFRFRTLYWHDDIKSLAQKIVLALERSSSGIHRVASARGDRLMEEPKLAAARRTFKPEGDPVKCTVFASPEVRQGGELLIQCFAHFSTDDARVRRLAIEYDENAKARGSRTFEVETERGSRITFNLFMPKGVENTEPVQNLVWQGYPEAVQFAIKFPKNFETGDYTGTVYVSREGVPCGHIKFKITVIAKCFTPSTKKSKQIEQWTPYKKAFISYASADRNEVLKRVQMLARLDIEYFQDVLNLEPGELWENELYKNIDKSDVFFLFWSNAARNSKWVMKEVHYALKRKVGDDLALPEIIPIIIEGPPPAYVPRELSHLHFNDKIVYFVEDENLKT
ncbi:MAG TPA: toll/interleukin-1 receptor domain-containing protein [Pyrinomonadaceae bacterium]|jgi:hypothetical protein